MPNWCYNSFQVFDSSEDNTSIDKFLTHEDIKNGITPLTKYLPRSEYHSTQEGYNNGGYEWSIRNWGTKWAEHDLCFIDNVESFDFSFDSAWAPPIEGYQSISMMFPSLYFLHYWSEEGMQFAGCAIYHDGNIVFMKEIEGDEFPEWQDEYADNPDEWSEKMVDMTNSLVGDAMVTLHQLMYIE